MPHIAFGLAPVVVGLHHCGCIDRIRILGIDAIGDEIEEPFGSDANDLPLNAISTMIEVNVLQRLNNETLPELKTPVPSPES